MRRPFLAFLVSLALIAPAAYATDIGLMVFGRVQSNSIPSGPFASVPLDSLVQIDLSVDSTIFIESTQHPGARRAYPFTYAAVFLQQSGPAIRLSTPAYMVVQNDNPREDALSISSAVDTDTPVALRDFYAPLPLTLRYRRSFGSIPPVGPDPTLHSVDILGADGHWGSDNLGVCEFEIVETSFQASIVIEGLLIQVADGCDGIDFNDDGAFPDAADIELFVAVFAGFRSSDCDCADIDFNNDGLVPDIADIDAFLTVFAGGECPN